VLRLQRAAGNRAVARLVTQQRKLARYDTGEHAQYGRDQVVFERGDVRVTQSEMVAMGDLYERMEDMDQADLGELRHLVELVRRDRDYYTGVKGAQGVSNEEWDKATPTGPHRAKSFMDLAHENATHFGPRAAGSDGKDHKAEWERVHRQALDIAHKATSAADAQRAMAYNAFAAHFLTDAFSAGHLVSKADVMERAKKSFDSLETHFWPLTQNVFTGVAADELLAHPKAGPKLKQYKLRLVGWDDMDADRLSTFLYGFANDEPQLFYETFIKLVHDKLNQTGVQVTNARGDGPWTLPGDGRMASSPKTLEVGNAALAASTENLITAHQTKGPLDYKALFARVWAFVPRPTAGGQRHVDDVVNRFTDPAHQADTLYGFVNFVADHIDGVISQLHGDKYNRLKTQAELDEEDRKKAAKRAEEVNKWRRSLPPHMSRF
jgi:hypothetical protein